MTNEHILRDTAEFLQGKFSVPAILAGGAVRDAFLGGNVRDLDVFVLIPPGWDTQELFAAFPLATPVIGPECSFDGLRPELKWCYDAGVSIHGKPLQLIGCELPDVEALIGSFDLGTSRVAYANSRLHTSKEFLRDFLYKTVTVYRCENLKQQERTKLRIQRLQQKYPDYRPDWAPIDLDSLH
jgi:hypothetical protein